jgi:hypothetical protein
LGLTDVYGTMMGEETAPVPTAHVDDDQSTSELADTLSAIHGESFEFAIDSWEPGTVIEPPPTRVAYHVVIEAEDASVPVTPGDRVRGRPPEEPYEQVDGSLATATTAHEVEVWPGDVVTVGPDDEPLELTGTGTYLAVCTEQTAYPAPRFAFVRYLPDDGGGCAEYDDAFRREVLPPVVSGADDDARGVNRINQHTIDMRHDREPQPVQHCHAPVTTGDGERAPHTETAIILDRSTYDRPPVDESDPHVRLFCRPNEDDSDWVDVPVEPGSIVVTPAMETDVYGHCFRNAFAALVAVPSFTAPLIELGEDSDREGETHRKYHQSEERRR